MFRASLIMAALVVAGCEPALDLDCDQGPAGCGGDQFCFVGSPPALLENGNINLERDYSYRCAPAPERCGGVASCECLGGSFASCDDESGRVIAFDRRM